MARLEGITGGLSGKMGSAVFRQSGGKTIASQYQPIVKNPNTLDQQNTRAAFKLMSQLAAIMKDGFGTMGVNERPARGRMSQRNAFFKLNYSLIEVTEENSQVTAKIPMEQLKLTSSFRFMPALELSGDSNGIEVQFTDTVPTEVSAIRFVTVGYNGNVASVIDIRDVPRTQFTNIIIPATSGKYTILAYGLIPSESASSSVNLDNIHTPSDEDFISAVELNTMVAAGTMAETMTVGENIEMTL